MALRIVKKRYWHAPGSLTGDAPVGPCFDSTVYTGLAPVRNPVYFADRIKRFSSKRGIGNRSLIVHLVIARLSYSLACESDLDEPLVHGSENRGRLAAPAI